MPYMKALDFPVQVLMEHDDNPVETIDDGWGPEPVYLIKAIEWAEQGGKTWDVHIEREGYDPFDHRITPLETGKKNLPTPQRFKSNNLLVRLTSVRT